MLRPEFAEWHVQAGDVREIGRHVIGKEFSMRGRASQETGGGSR